LPRLALNRNPLISVARISGVSHHWYLAFFFLTVEVNAESKGTHPPFSIWPSWLLEAKDVLDKAEPVQVRRSLSLPQLS
jgi:hypothetical protein